MEEKTDKEMEVASREVGAASTPPSTDRTRWSLFNKASVLGRFLSSSISSSRDSHRAERDEKMELMEGEEGGRKVKLI